MTRARVPEGMDRTMERRVPTLCSKPYIKINSHKTTNDLDSWAVLASRIESSVAPGRARSNVNIPKSPSIRSPEAHSKTLAHTL